MKTKSRKQARKEFRRAKKIKKHEFFSRKKPKNENFQKNTFQVEPKQKLVGGKKKKSEDEKVEVKVNKREFKNPHERNDFERMKEKKQKEALEKQIYKQRIKQLKVDNMKEDVEIKKLEKQLKMHKGKSKAFAVDGLDYLLDVCDKRLTEKELNNKFDDSDTEFESDFENIMGKSKNKHAKSDDESEEFEDDNLGDSMEEENTDEEEDDVASQDSEISGSENEVKTKQTKSIVKNSQKRKMNETNKKVKNKTKKVKFEEESDLDGDDDGDDDVENDSDDEVEDDIDDDEDDGGDNDHDDLEDDDSLEDKDETVKSNEVTKMWEDIYGRTRDEKGNVIKTYTPPHLRKKSQGDDEKNSEKLLRLKKQLKGLLNRLSESNMAFISNQIEQLYMSNSRNDMNETLCALFTDSLVTEVLTPERLITEHAMLIAVLHSNIGSEIGAHFLQYAVTEFNKMLESNVTVEDKRINNILLFITHLYNFQIFHSKLMYDILNELLKNLEEKQIELLLLTFRTVGFNLRKDDPLALKALVLKVQEKANSLSTGENSSRVKFMLEMLMAIKNNNMSKIPNYNPELVEKMRKSLKVLVRKGNYSTELNISLQDLLNAEKQGRWWIVGSAWSGSAPTQPDSNKTKEEPASTEFSQKILELARKQRMNTDVRRNIFCILMSAEDFLEAFEKLIKLKLKGAVEREIMNVLLHCALQEKNFNPYYYYLANKFCTFDRKYQMMLQCAVWDRIKELKNSLPIQVTNLAKFVGNAILERGLPISVLKVIQFSELDKPTIKFMRQVLLTILMNEDKNTVAAAFRRIADSSKLKLFRESLRLFLRHFVLKNAKNIDEEKASRLADMVKLAEQALDSSDGRIEF